VRLRRKIKNWNEAFDRLTELIETSNDNARNVIFFNEMPWLDTPRSGFLGAFEYLLDKKYSLAVNVDRIVFSEGAPLANYPASFGDITHSLTRRTAPSTN
jgi:hypothetical protein